MLFYDKGIQQNVQNNKGINNTTVTGISGRNKLKKKFLRQLNFNSMANFLG